MRTVPGSVVLAIALLAGGRREVQLTPAPGSTYYLVTSYDLCQERISGTDSTGTPQPSSNLACAP